MSLDFRAQRGEAIAQMEGAVRRLDDSTYVVKSQSGRGDYILVSGEFGWICPCLDAQFRSVRCKHQWAVEFSRRFRAQVKAAVVIQPLTVGCCPMCKSESIRKRGLRHNGSGDIQKFRCDACGHWFTVNVGFERMHATPQMITSAMQLYFSGESLRNTQKFLALQGLNVSHVAILKWIRKYVGLMDGYLAKITPKVSDTWRADEVYVKFKGNRKYLFAMMDDETRFWIAQQVSNFKENTNAVHLFRMAKEATGKEPKTLITDALGSYKMAAEFEFKQATHIREIAIDGKVHNNKMERMNGEVRDREKVMRGLKRMDTPILKGYQLYHNYIRPHEGLNGATPADKAGIKVEGDNKWMTIIQNAQAKALEGQTNSG
jgi:putative transposase